MTDVIPVISGKGGVGKSTVAVNLAIALAATGRKVGLIDADFYGPSIPTMFGGGELKADAEGMLIPAEKFGLRYVSIGFLLGDPDTPIIWRGPMFNKALNQFFNDVAWGELDCFVIDMPPGTGDAQLSLAQMIQISGAVVVTTPQEVALADVRKAVNMLDKVNVEVLGVIENMSGFTAPDGTVCDIFGSGGGARLAESLNVPLLGSIPIDPAVRRGGDEGVPVVSSGDTPVSLTFRDAALKLVDILDTKRKAAPKLNVVN